jgi:hypothetical protein
MKNYGRRLSEQARTESEHHTANVVYYAAIASALVFHEQRITSFSNKELKLSFTLLGKAKWIPSDLSRLFRKAVLSDVNYKFPLTTIISTVFSQHPSLV